MSTLTIVEGQGIGKQASSDQQAMMLPHITIQRITFTGSAGYSVALNANTSLVRLLGDANFAFLQSATSSAAVTSVTGIPMVASSAEYFSVNPGINYISVVGTGV